MEVVGEDPSIFELTFFTTKYISKIGQTLKLVKTYFDIIMSCKSPGTKIVIYNYSNT